MKEHIKLRNISVAVPKHETHILKDVTFKILKG